MDIIPASLHRLVACDIFAGADPVFAGLHRFEDMSYDRSYRDVEHVCHPEHLSHGSRPDRRLTVVLPRVPPLDNLIHELGHVVDYHLQLCHQAEPVSWYGGTNRSEAFAEAWTSWLVPGYADRPDAATLDLFERLAAPLA